MDIGKIIYLFDSLKEDYQLDIDDLSSLYLGGSLCMSQFQGKKCIESWELGLMTPTVKDVIEPV
jgi:hypothetical protein